MPPDDPPIPRWCWRACPRCGGRPGATYRYRDTHVPGRRRPAPRDVAYCPRCRRSFTWGSAPKPRPPYPECMPTDPLFAVYPGPHGALRRLLAEQTAGRDLPGDLLHVVESLADRIDAANAAGAYRGFVMLTAEYRAARADLLGDLAPADDPLTDLLAELAGNDVAATTVRDPAE